MAERDIDAERAILISNERAKLRANFLNGLAVAVFAVGGLAPIVTAISSLNAPGITLSIVGTLCVLLSYALHSYAMKTLQDIRL